MVRNSGELWPLVAITVALAIPLLYVAYSIYHNQVDSAKQESICKRFCEALAPLGFSYDKVGYDDIREDYVCYCKRKQTIYVNGTDYLVEYTLPYGHIYNFTVLNETTTD